MLRVLSRRPFGERASPTKTAAGGRTGDPAPREPDDAPVSELAVRSAFLLPQFVGQSILSGDMSKFVRLPVFITREEWIASHVFEFFHLVNAFYESISEHCTAKSCGPLDATEYRRSAWATTDRSCRSTVQLHWANGLPEMLAQGASLQQASSHFHGSASQPASMFIDYALTWIDQQLEDPQNFPTHSGKRQIPSVR